jgi:hypothetical protein
MIAFPAHNPLSVTGKPPADKMRVLIDVYVNVN